MSLTIHDIFPSFFTLVGTYILYNINNTRTKEFEKERVLQGIIDGHNARLVELEKIVYGLELLAKTPREEKNESSD